MLCHRYLLSQVSLVLSWLMLMSVMRQVNTYTECVNNSTPSPKVNMNCTDPKGRIEVLSLLYADFKNQTQPQTCPGSFPGANCSQMISTGKLLSRNSIFLACSAVSQCSATIFHQNSQELTCPAYNYFMANYTCVNETEIMDLCGDKLQNVTSLAHLAYFHAVTKPPIQSCDCIVQGGAHQLKAAYVSLPGATKENCSITSLKVHWSEGNAGNKTWKISNGSSLPNECLMNKSDITWIKYKGNCSAITQTIWLKVQPVNGSQPTIYCGNSRHNIPKTTTAESTIPSSFTSPTTMNETTEDAITANTTSFMTSSSTAGEKTEMSFPSPSTSSTAVPTNATSNTSAVNKPSLNKDSSSQVEVIIGSVIGGFFAVVIATVLIIVLHRRHKSRKRTESCDPVGSGVGTSRYEKTTPSMDLPLVAVGQPQDLHNASYDHTGGNDNPGMYNNNSGNVYNHAAGGQEYDHIQSVATVHPSFHNKQTDATYNNLYAGRNSALQLKGDEDLSESNTDMIDLNSTTDAATAAIYSEIQDKPRSEEYESDTKCHEGHDDQTNEGFVENDLYQTVDEQDMDKRPTQGEQGQRFYHVLEKDFGSDVPENSPDKDVYQGKTSSSFPLQSQGLENEGIELVESDLYQSVDQIDADKRPAQHAQGGKAQHFYHILEKDFDQAKGETEFADNDLYQSADQL